MTDDLIYIIMFVLKYQIVPSILFLSITLCFIYYYEYSDDLAIYGALMISAFSLALFAFLRWVGARESR